jgi:lauroyl/myristoyl acyltransferase
LRQTAAHRWRHFHLAGASLAAAVGLLPRRWRFRAAMLIARAAEPFVRRTEPFRRQQRSRVDGAREIAAHLVLHTLTRNGCEFDPDVDVRGWDDFVRACRDGRGVLLAAPHAALGLMLLRLFHEYRLPAVTVTGEDERIPGTRLAAPTMQPSPTFLVSARSRMRRGEAVCAMLDRDEHHEGRTFEVETANGPVIVAPALLQVAAACGAQVAFTSMHVEGLRLSGTIDMAAGTTAEELTREYAEFVRAHVAARFGAAS